MPELFGFVSDLESELDASMEEVFRLDSDCSCPLVPAFPLEYHMTLYDTLARLHCQTFATQGLADYWTLQQNHKK
jgi:hypothetical protein